MCSTYKHWNNSNIYCGIISNRKCIDSISSHSEKSRFIMQALLSLFTSLLLSLLTDKLQSCLSSVCWLEATEAPPCHSGMLCSSDRLLDVITLLVSHPYTLKILQTSNGCADIQMTTCQMQNVGSQSQTGMCQTSRDLFIRRTKNNDWHTACGMLFSEMLFGNWLHFHTHSNCWTWIQLPMSKMQIKVNSLMW